MQKRGSIRRGEGGTKEKVIKALDVLHITLLPGAVL
jgi:hypothetical protein